MESQIYIELKKALHQSLLEFIDGQEREEEESYTNLVAQIKEQKIAEDKNELKSVLYLILRVSNNHHRTTDFFSKIETILFLLQKPIKKFLSNYEVFEIFRNNKRLILFLLDINVLQMDQMIAKRMLEKDYLDQNYPQYFYPEIQKFIDKKNAGMISTEMTEDFDEMRKIGENNDELYQMIKNDSIEEFITFVNKKFLPLSSLIDPSIFETNCFLLKNKKLNLIEHAAFFGSIQIFKYLHINGVELKPSIWIQAIHGNNPEVINYIQEKNVVPDDQSYEECLKEAVKCHHNDIVVYILDYLLDKKVETVNRHKKYNKNLLVYCFHYRNYISFPSRFQNNRFLFYYACEYDYFYIVKSLLNDKKMNLNGKIINNIFLIGLPFRIF